MDPEPGSELTERLEAYGHAVLEPDPVAMAAIRGRLVAEARSRVAVGPMTADQATAAVVAAPALHRWGRLLDSGASSLHRWGRSIGSFTSLRLAQRSAVAFGTLALVAAYGAGVSVASAPGAPLYDARLFIESATLPSSGSARVTAEMQLLDARLSEAHAAASRRDSTALAAALAAYQRTVDDASRNVITPADEEGLESALGRHEAELAALVAPAAEQGSETGALLQAAIEHMQTTIDRLHGGAAGGDGPGNGAGTGTGGATPTPNDGGSAGNGNGQGNEHGQGGDGAAGHPTPGPGGNGQDGHPTPGAGGHGQDGHPTPGAGGNSGHTPNPGNQGGNSGHTPNPGNQGGNSGHTPKPDGNGNGGKGGQ